MTASINRTGALSKEKRIKAEKLIDSFYDDFKISLKLYFSYGSALDFSTIEIEEGKIKTTSIDFDFTCI